jgi:hypothetical protein
LGLSVPSWAWRFPCMPKDRRSMEFYLTATYPLLIIATRLKSTVVKLCAQRQTLSQRRFP